MGRAVHPRGGRCIPPSHALRKIPAIRLKRAGRATMEGEETRGALSASAQREEAWAASWVRDDRVEVQLPTRGNA